MATPSSSTASTRSNDAVNLLLLTIFSNTARAQDLFRAAFDYAPPSTIQAENITGDASARFIGYDISLLTPPIKLIPDRLMWINGLGFSQTNSQIFDATGLQNTDDQVNLFSITLNMFVLASLSEKWSLSLVIVPGFHGNFSEGVSGRDFLMQGIGLVTYELNEKISLGGGGGYANIFGIPQPLGALQFTYEGERFSVNALLPRNLDLWYEVVDDSWSVGLQGVVEGGYFHRAPEEISEPDNIFIQYSVGTMGPSVQKSFGPLKLTANVGVMFLRRYNIIQDDDFLFEFELERAMSGGVSLSITPPRQNP